MPCISAWHTSPQIQDDDSLLALEGHREAWHVQVLLLFYSLQLGI